MRRAGDHVGEGALQLAAFRVPDIEALAHRRAARPSTEPADVPAGVVAADEVGHEQPRLVAGVVVVVHESVPAGDDLLQVAHVLALVEGAGKELGGPYLRWPVLRRRGPGE